MSSLLSHRVPLRSSRSGQVFVEACIALALMAFVWILITYSLWMANNRIRTAMAARHAAWLAGNVPSLTEEEVTGNIDSSFFYENGLVKAVRVDGVPINGSKVPGIDLDGIFAKLVNTITIDDGPCRCRVSFGMEKTDLATTTRFPFVLMNAQVPLMPEPVLDNFLSVRSTCQWAKVGYTWGDLRDILKGLGLWPTW
jgi:hypothetical protein